MTRPATAEERADWLDLAQRIRATYGQTLEARLAAMQPDIIHWWWVCQKASGPTPAVPGAGPNTRQCVTADGSRRSKPAAAPPTLAEPQPQGERALPPQVREIIRAVAVERGVAVSDIMSWRKTGPIADARQECYRRLRAMPWRGSRPSLLQIGLWLHRDHTTVLHGIQKEEITHGAT